MSWRGVVKNVKAKSPWSSLDRPDGNSPTGSFRSSGMLAVYRARMKAGRGGLLKIGGDKKVSQ